MLGYVKFGLQHMEPAFGIVFVDVNEREVSAQQSGTKAFKITVVGPDEEPGDRPKRDACARRRMGSHAGPAIRMGFDIDDNCPGRDVSHRHSRRRRASGRREHMGLGHQQPIAATRLLRPMDRAARP
jgi:hypothetical protein